MILWARGWYPLEDERRRQYLEGELRWELAAFPDHPLHAREFQAVGLWGVYDHLILYTPAHGEYGWANLSWTRERPPTYLPIGGEAELNVILASWETPPRRQEGE